MYGAFLMQAAALVDVGLEDDPEHLLARPGWIGGESGGGPPRLAKKAPIPGGTRGSVTRKRDPFRRIFRQHGKRPGTGWWAPLGDATRRNATKHARQHYQGPHATQAR